MQVRTTSPWPPGALLIPLIVKPALFWLFVRVAMAFLGMVVPPPVVSFGVLAVVLTMVWADMKLLRERPFFDNLGFGRLPSATVVIVTLEAVAGVAGRVLL